MWLVPTFKTTAAENLAAGGPRRGAASRARLGPRHALHRRLLDGPASGAGCVAQLRLATPAHRQYGVINDILHSFAGERADDWPARVPMVEFAINDLAQPLSGQAACPSTPTAAIRPPLLQRDPAGSGEAAAHLMSDCGSAGAVAGAAGPAQGGAPNEHARPWPAPRSACRPAAVRPRIRVGPIGSADVEHPGPRRCKGASGSHGLEKRLQFAHIAKE